MRTLKIAELRNSKTTLNGIVSVSRFLKITNLATGHSNCVNHFSGELVLEKKTLNQLEINSRGLNTGVGMKIARKRGPLTANKTVEAP